MRPYDVGAAGGPDLDALAALFAASGDGGDRQDADATRRASLRILARAGALHPGVAWLDAMRGAVAYGDTCTTDPVLLADADRCAAWRGLLLRHRPVGAWRSLWAEMVKQIVKRVVRRDDLHAWIADRLPNQRVADMMAGLPPVIDGSGHPVDAETAIAGQDLTTAHRDVAVLMLGARRVGTLDGVTRSAFLGRRRAFLDPSWVENQVADHADQSVRDLGCALVDDMLAQARRVALRKMQLTSSRMTLFSRVHERDGTYTADSEEGSGNVGLRIEQLAGLGRQMGLLATTEAGPPTVRGAHLLGLPA